MQVRSAFLVVWESWGGVTRVPTCLTMMTAGLASFVATIGDEPAIDNAYLPSQLMMAHI